MLWPKPWIKCPPRPSGSPRYFIDFKYEQQLNQWVSAGKKWKLCTRTRCWRSHWRNATQRVKYVYLLQAFHDTCRMFFKCPCLIWNSLKYVLLHSHCWTVFFPSIFILVCQTVFWQLEVEPDAAVCFPIEMLLCWIGYYRDVAADWNRQAENNNQYAHFSSFAGKSWNIIITLGVSYSCKKYCFFFCHFKILGFFLGWTESLLLLEACPTVHIEKNIFEDSTGLVQFELLNYVDIL